MLIEIGEVQEINFRERCKNIDLDQYKKLILFEQISKTEDIFNYKEEAETNNTPNFEEVIMKFVETKIQQKYCRSCLHVTAESMARPKDENSTKYNCQDGLDYFD